MAAVIVLIIFVSLLVGAVIISHCSYTDTKDCKAIWKLRNGKWVKVWER